jgi:hypothetical protein
MLVPPARKFRPRRYRPGNTGSWSGHLPFVNDAIAALRPSLLVELGTHYGESYFGMCQAVEENGVSCKCYAVDTWRGDAHAGYYDESVFEEVRKYNEENYGAFSELLRNTFDEAIGSFGHESIDLLHLDGLHTYEAVRHDFENWFPKVRPGGLVLLHDTVARHLDFQVWRLWEELAPRFPHFEFTHGWGLGVLRKPGGKPTDSTFLDVLFSASVPEAEFLRHYYSLQAAVLERAQPRKPAAWSPKETCFQVFPRLSDAFTEATSIVTTVKIGEWQHIALELPQGSPDGPIRVDPCDRACLIEFAGVVLRRATDGAVLKAWTNPAEIRAFAIVSDLVPLSGDGPQFLSTGPDPQLLLPEVEPGSFDQPLVLDARVRIHEHLDVAVTSLEAANEAVSHRDQAVNDLQAQRDAAVERTRELAAELQQLGAERDAAVARTHELAAELRQLGAERDAAVARTHELGAELRNVQTERIAVAAEYRRISAANESLRGDISALKNSLESLEAKCSRLEQDATSLRDARVGAETQLQNVRAELRAAYRSQSWRLTVPLRWLKRTIRRTGHR